MKHSSNYVYIKHTTISSPFDILESINGKQIGVLVVRLSIFQASPATETFKEKPLETASPFAKGLLTYKDLFCE